MSKKVVVKSTAGPARASAALPSLGPAAGETIRVVSKRTGFSMEVLRAWERRYGFPKPERRHDSNRRLYSAADVDRLVAIRHALDRGYRIGDVIGMSSSELAALSGVTAAMAPKSEGGETRDVTELVDLLAADDVRGLEDALRHAAAALGPKRFVTELAHPFAVAVGDAWVTGAISVRHEHVASEVLTTRIRQVLAAYQDVEGSPRVLLATLPGEPHTLALQMVALYLVVGSAKPLLLGGPTPASEIVQAAEKLGADVVGLTVTPVSDAAEARRAIRGLSRELPRRVPIWVGGGGAPALGLDPKVARTTGSWSAIDEALAAWRSARSASRSSTA